VARCYAALHGFVRHRLATKRDLAELETRLAKDIAQTNARIAATKAELIKWVLGALTAQTALLLGAMKLL